jgi:hypothetical protein
MQIEETQTIKQYSPELTACKTEARIISKFGFGLTSRIEGFGQTTFIANTAKARKGMQYMLQIIREKQANRAFP